MDSRTGLPVVGMVGGGQLARMTHQAAIALGQSLRVLALTPDDGAALVAADVRYGDHTDLAALRAFAEGCDVVTFDHEHVPTGHVRALAEAGVPVHPAADALLHAQDKRVMRERLTALAAPVPRWRPVTAADEVRAFGAEVGWPVVLKASRGGYDGRGVWPLADPTTATEQVDRLLAGGTELIVEERVPLTRELAVQVARSPFGQVAAYPVVETVQRDGICVEVLAPAPGLPEDRAVAAQQLAIDLATALDVVGLLAVELFETPAGLVVNELAMRPHNSGHWTIEGARTSQFEQHLRAVLDYPMGDTGLTAPAVVMANVLGGEPGGMSIDERLHHMFAEDPGVKVHLYGKQVRPGRKIGHVTVLGDDLDKARARAVRAARWLREGA
ncbi:5-(carboxyamino)imidazole ribonucleotide synthase [Micromonospora zhanjiangensis]|uniref:N5-carboxyaminoimidazole ribonucleotide synthase n=1 Tax=Micromonospora zhanjiangensis TaxID=1522057 RepID=A0ABV8KS12_9ACTN